MTCTVLGFQHSLHLRCPLPSPTPTSRQHLLTPTPTHAATHTHTALPLPPQVFRPINPKAVTRNELYGYLQPSTREWREGLVSVAFREMSNNKSAAHQWIVLDGDIDAEWIESMNTVMASRGLGRESGTGGGACLRF